VTSVVLKLEKVGTNGVGKILLKNAKPLVVEAVEIVKIVDTSKVRDDADVSESNEGLWMHPCSSSSCVPIIAVVADGTLGTMSGTIGKTLGLDGAASVGLPLLGVAVELAVSLMPAVRGFPIPAS
jgi:hypothetical protein